MQAEPERGSAPYRAEAARLRREAERMEHGPARAELFSIAQSYDRLAEIVQIIHHGEKRD